MKRRSEICEVSKKILFLYEQGWSKQEIADIFERPYFTVDHLIQRAKEKGYLHCRVCGILLTKHLAGHHNNRCCEHCMGEKENLRVCFY